MENNQKKQRPVRVLGTPIEKDGAYVIEAAAKQNKVCGWVCPKCHKPIIICPPIAGQMWVTCRTCKVKTLITVTPDEDVSVVENPEPAVEPAPAPAPKPEPKPEPVPAPAPEKKFDESKIESYDIPGPTNGVLSWGNIFRRKKHVLKEGKTIIGRNDPDTHSDLEINDSRISRRSVCIEAKRKAEGGFSFKLTVLKSGNPVLVDNKQIGEGETVVLEKRNAITLGKTVMNFKET